MSAKLWYTIPMVNLPEEYQEALQTMKEEELTEAQLQEMEDDDKSKLKAANDENVSMKTAKMPVSLARK